MAQQATYQGLHFYLGRGIGRGLFSNCMIVIVKYYWPMYIHQWKGTGPYIYDHILLEILFSSLSLTVHILGERLSYIAGPLYLRDSRV